MSPTTRLFGLTNAALHDFGVGLWLTYLLAKGLDVHVSYWCYLAGMAFSVLPDADIVVGALLKRMGVKIKHHRDLFHFPILFVPVVVAVTVLIAQWLHGNQLFWGLLAFTCLIMHFVHDSTGEANGCGLTWLGPFSPTFYRLFGTANGRRYLVRAIPGDVVLGYYSKTVDEWLIEYYVRLTPEALLGQWLFVSGVVLALFS
ncbi:MAG: metal-dependent hydrolase [Patescibacteria group bacterium]|jgi:hypothetical protein